MNKSKSLTEYDLRFCQLYIRTGNAAKSYREVYPRKHIRKESSWVAGCRNMQREEIKAEIDRLRNEFRQNMITDAAWCVEQHRQLYEEARHDGDLANARRNVRDIGETMGIYKDNLNVTGDLGDIDDEALDERIRELAREVAAEDAAGRKAAKATKKQTQELSAKP